MFGQLQYLAILVCRTVRCVDIKRLKSSVLLFMSGQVLKGCISVFMSVLSGALLFNNYMPASCPKEVHEDLLSLSFSCCEQLRLTQKQQYWIRGKVRID